MSTFAPELDERVEIVAPGLVSAALGGDLECDMDVAVLL